MLLRALFLQYLTNPQIIMLIKHARYLSETYVIHVTNKDSPCQCLGEKIHQVVHRRYLVNHHATF